MEQFSYKVGCGICKHTHILRKLKEELTGAIDEQHQVIGNMMLFKIVPLRN